MFRGVIVLFVVLLASSFAQEKKKTPFDIEELRKELEKSALPSILRDKSDDQLLEVNLVRESILKSGNSAKFSDSLAKKLNEKNEKSERVSSVLGMKAEEAIANPSINVIDHHIKEIVNSDRDKNRFNEEVKKISRHRIQNSELHNLYRENLRIKSISEETKFKIGDDVDQWKTISLESEVVLFGLTPQRIIVAVGSNGTYEVKQEIELKSPAPKMCIEAMKVWDYEGNKLRTILLLASNTNLIWYELDDSKKIYQFRQSSLPKNIDKVSYFQHDGSDLIMLTTIDEQKRAEVNFYEFNLSIEDFWLVQHFKLPNLPESMVCLDAGRHFLIAFTQNSEVAIYRHQNTKFERGKFAFMKTIKASNVSVITGFRIGGHSYLAIGGDQPEIYRYVNGDLQAQSILSQTFGHVDEFLPIPIKIYRDDLVLLVQHRIIFPTHTLVAVDALIWNGIAFESALSVPCRISVDPNASGFTCMIDVEREEGLLGSNFIVEDRKNSFHVIIPRNKAHSGLFRIRYEITEAEDPLIKEMEQIKKVIELVDGMLEKEASVKRSIDDFFAHLPFNPENIFSFADLELSEVETNVLEHIEKVTLESDRIEFLNNVTFTKEDVLALDLLDSMEKTLLEDEEKLRKLDAELNKVVRINRQVPTSQRNRPPNSPVINLGPFNFNGQLNSQTARVIPPHPRNRRQIGSFEDVGFNSISIENIDAETINGVPFEKFLFLQNDGELFVPDKDVIFEDSIEVRDNVIMTNDGKVNNIDLNRDVLAVDSPNFPKNLTLENVFVDNLNVGILNEISVSPASLKDLNLNFEDNLPTIKSSKARILGNLNVETVNGVNWNNFVRSLIPRNHPSSVESLTVNGNLWIIGDRSDLQAKSINDAKFPEEYVLRNGPTETVINGKKSFIGGLATNEIDTDGKINELSPLELITLDQPQHIPVNTTFNIMEVVKKLEVNGTISGQHLDEFLPNPTLEIAKEILASCTFKELFVEGDVKIGKSFNKLDLEKTLTDVIYEDDIEVVIAAPKEFLNLEVKNNLNISSNFINNVNLSDVMTTNGEQEVNFDRLQGDVRIQNLKLGGLFDGVNATQLEIDSVRTFGDQFIETPLIIASGGRVGANSINIKSSLNEIPVGDYFFTDQIIEFAPNARVEFIDLTVDASKIASDVIGQGALKNFNMQELERNCLSKSLKQMINVPVQVKTLTTRGTFAANSVNGIDFEVFKNYMRQIKNYRKALLAGQHKIDNLIVDGNVVAPSINDRNFSELLNQVFWLNRENSFGEIEFLDEIDVKGNLSVEAVNGKNFDSFLSGWISKNENPIEINGDVTSEKEVMVVENLVAREINRIKFEDFLRKQDVVDVEMLNIAGSMIVDKVTVQNAFNGRPMKELSDLYSYDEKTYEHSIKADVNFHQPTTIAYLNTPFLNGKDIKNWIESLIKVNDNNVYVKGKKTFKGTIAAQNGIHMDFINGISIKDLIKNILTLNSDISINGDLIFEGEIYADIIALRENLTTDNMNGCYLKEWLENHLPIDRDVNFDGEIQINSPDFSAKYLTVNKINEIPFGDFITLRTNQSFERLKVEGSLHVEEPLKVGALYIPGFIQKVLVDLNSERQNTVMAYDQNVTISTPMIFTNKIHVLGSMTTNGRINSKEINKIVLLNSSPTFDSKLRFKSLEVQSIYSSAFITRVDFNKWYESRVWKNSKDAQVITGDWNIKEAKFNADVTGNGLINGRSFSDIEKNLKENVEQVQAFLSNYTGQYANLCGKMKNQVESYAKNSIHILKYFELDFKLVEKENIYSFFDILAPKNNHFLLVNTECSSHIYKWIQAKERFIKTASIETGFVDDFATIEHKNDDFYIITISKKSTRCKYNGVNSWKVEDSKLVHITTINAEPAILELYSDASHPTSFFALDKSDRVLNFDVFGTKIEEWKLPSENLAYNFMPFGILPGLNLYNGRRIFSIESKTLKRTKRMWFDDHNERKAMKNESKKIVIKDPDFLIPIIQPFAMKTVDSDWSKIKKVEDSLNLNLDGFKRKSLLGDNKINARNSELSNDTTTSAPKIEWKWPKMIYDELFSKSLEPEPKKSSPPTKHPVDLAFIIKKPDITKLSNFTTKSAAKGDVKDLKMKTVGQSIMETIMKPSMTENTKINDDLGVTESSTAESVSTTEFNFTPRIITPSEDEIEETTILSAAENQTTSPTELEDENRVEATVVQGSGIRETENSFIPEQGEITVIFVGPADQKKVLYAVSKRRSSFVLSSGKGNDFIEIYSDIVEGRVFQYIQCKNPSHITALHFRDETLLAFMESRQEVQVLIYRGIQGFVFFKSIPLSSYAHQMTSVILPPKIQYKCDHHYLAIQVDNELQFMLVKVDGNCGISHVECDFY